MKLHQLEALVIAADLGSIRAAARALNLTQAALTKSLRQLELEAGVAIIVRSSRGVQLTPPGLRLLQRARLVTQQLRLAADELKTAASDADTGRVSVGITPFLTLTTLGEAFKAFRQRYPLVAVQVSEGLVGRALLALREGAIDFALVADTGDVPGKEFATQNLGSHAQKIVARKRHPIHQQAAAQLTAALAKCEWLLPGQVTRPARGGIATADTVNDSDEPLTGLFQRAHLVPPTQLTRAHAMAGIALVRNADLVSIFPARLLAEPECRDIIEIVAPDLKLPAIKLLYIARADVPLTPAAAHFSQCLVSAAAR